MSFFDRGWMRYPHECAFGISLMLVALFLGINLYFDENPTSVAFHFLYPYLYSHTGFWVLHFAVAMIAVFSVMSGISAYEGERSVGSIYGSEERDGSGKIIMPVLMSWLIVTPFVTFTVMSWMNLPGEFKMEWSYPIISFAWPVVLFLGGPPFIAHSVRIYRW